MEREKLGSRLGFILLSAGCAIGCGNVWKFPWMCGQYGGGAFLLIYLICLVILGIPVMTMEFSLGRASQASPVRMYKKLEKPGTKWHIHGYAALIGNVCLMAFYTVVCGWMIYYFIKFLTGGNAEVGFVPMITNPTLNVTYLAVTVLVAFGILCFNLQNGLERVTKYMMIILLVLMLALAVHSCLLPGAAEGLKFYLVPDLSAITGDVIVGAMNQAFFTLSLGIGSMAIFGSYIGKGRALLGESLNVILLDTFVAVVAGLIIFPACTTYNEQVNAELAALGSTLVLALFGLELQAAGGVQDGAAGLDDVGNTAQVHFKALAVQQAVVAALNADHPKSLVQAGTNHSAHCSIHAGSVAAAGQDTNRFDLLFHKRDSLHLFLHSPRSSAPSS